MYYFRCMSDRLAIHLRFHLIMIYKYDNLTSIPFLRYGPSMWLIYIYIYISCYLRQTCPLLTIKVIFFVVWKFQIQKGICDHVIVDVNYLSSFKEVPMILQYLPFGRLLRRNLNWKGQNKQQKLLFDKMISEDGADQHICVKETNHGLFILEVRYKMHIPVIICHCTLGGNLSNKNIM